ncbi:myozenin-1a [Genypterus blacodes]|uniref:myozenin-1a n=1 Tax=Genypterus blacodes TaxID=154954 RepID=UPI003F771C42
MPLGTPAPLMKRKKPSKIITDLAHIMQNEYESEPEASEFDLGTKIRTPKDIMLEELSLMKNKGSKMFKLRKQRVERFIYENNPDVFTSDSMDSLQKFVPGIGGQMVSTSGCLVGHGGNLYLNRLQTGGGPPVPPPKPGSKGGAGAGGAGGAGGGAGGQGKGSEGQGGIGEGAGGEWSPLKGGGGSAASKKLIMVKTYVSPWEKAMKGDEGLVATMKTSMPGPIMSKDFMKYKSFNRSAMPFGGYEKANQLMKFQLPEPTQKEPEPTVVYHQEGGGRPSFNRTPIGWVGSCEPSSIHIATDAVPFDCGETDEL